MYRNDWNDHMGNGRGIVMLVVCALFIGLIGLIVWLVVSSTRRHHGPPPQPHAGPSPVESAARPSALQILDERLARGEIEVDDYRARLEALRAASDSPA